MTDINPALNAEEWAEYLAVDRAYDFSAWREDGTDDRLDRHAAAALALHGQSFGFTWDDVDALMESPPDEPKLSEVAHRIAALLPPRK